MTLYILANNIHQGGGKSLMRGIVNELRVDANIIMCVDQRFISYIPESFEYDLKPIRPSIFGRLQIEFWLYRNVRSSDIVLYFTGIPPLINFKSKNVVFIQNRYFVDSVSLTGFKLKQRIYLILRQFWFSITVNNADEYIVQTTTMKMLLRESLKARRPIKVFPFIGSLGVTRSKVAKDLWSDRSAIKYVYVSTGDPHKNHKTLISAWVLLSQEGLFPQLVLTLDDQSNVDLIQRIYNQSKMHNLNVRNMGALEQADVFDLYSDSTALIYPSLVESFGLPLVEADRLGLPIIAPELDYVRDVVDPDQTFDPNSPVSIARAVKRFEGLDEERKHVNTANDFIRYVISDLDE